MDFVNRFKRRKQEKLESKFYNYIEIAKHNIKTTINSEMAEFWYVKALGALDLAENIGLIDFYEQFKIGNEVRIIRRNNKMKVEITANGKSVQAEISEEQLKELELVEERSRTGYERVEKGSTYFYNYSSDDTDNDIDKKDMVDQEYYNNANYYSDKIIAENNARADRLLRCLRQWQAQNDKPISVKYWEDETWPKWRIMYNYDDKNLFGNPQRSARVFNTVYFTTKEKAQEAIEQFKGELLWYFTEYQQRLDEV